jgi:hypothetical protein
MMPRQFRLRSLFILTAIVAVGCLLWPLARAYVNAIRVAFELMPVKLLP